MGGYSAIIPGGGRYGTWDLGNGKESQEWNRKINQEHIGAHIFIEG